MILNEKVLGQFFIELHDDLSYILNWITLFAVLEIDYRRAKAEVRKSDRQDCNFQARDDD